MLYDGSVIAKETNVISIADSEETLMLEEESRSKMLLKQSDPMVLEKKVNIKKINYSMLNRLSEDFSKRFVPQQELSDEQAFRLKKIKYHLGEFDNMVKKHITPDALTEGEWGFEHTKAIFIKEIIPFVKTLKDIFNVFNKDLLNEKQFLIENDRLLDQIISQDIVNIVVNSSMDINTFVNVNSSAAMNDSVNYVEMCNKCLELEAELIKQHNMEKVFVITTLKNDLRKFKGKDIVDNVTQVSNATTIALGMYKLDPVTLSPKDKNNRETHIYYLKHTMEQAVILREIVEQAKSLNLLDRASYSACKYVKLIQELLGYVRDTCPDIHKPSEKLVAVTPINKKKTVRFAEPVISSSTSQKQLGSSQTKTKQTTNNFVSTSTGVSRSTKSSRSKSIDNTKNDRIMQTSSSTQKKNKVEDHSRIVKSCLNKPNCVVEPSGNENVQHSKLIYKFFVMCVKMYSSMFAARHECKKRDVTKIGYNWRPTGRTFTLVENACPLTRITATNKVPLREPIPLEVVAQESIVTKVYTRRPKFLGTVKFGNNQIAKIMGYGDYQIGNIIISRVYYVEGLGHNLFSVGQFCDSDLEVAFRKHTCFVHNLEGVDLLSKSRGTNLYSLSIKDMMTSCPICLWSKATKTKSWLWHRRIKKQSHKPKSKDTNQEKLYLLHMDLCGPMRVASINGKNYILVIVDDYSRFTWVKFLASKDEAPDFIIKFLKMIQVRLNATIRNIRRDNGTEFVNQTLRDYYEQVGISHETSIAQTLQQNGVVERQNHMLVEAARTMLIFAQAPLFLWICSKEESLPYYNRRLVPNPPPQASFIPPSRHEWDLVFQPVFDEFFFPPASVASPVPVKEAPKSY
ncbi:retrovirus-related pol polyprotein from transposon TNT 1-94 [Tanacetum coccineum]